MAQEIDDDADIQVMKDGGAPVERCVICHGPHEWIDCPEMDDIYL